MFDKIKKKVKRLQNDINYPSLNTWQDKFTNSKTEYETNLTAIEQREQMYNGTDDILRKDGTYATAKSKYTRNIVAEIIEAKVDSSIPMPKVSARRAEDEDRSQTIENFLRNEIDLEPFEELNDLDERTTYIQGGSYYLIEWDNDINTHKTVGGLRVSLLHPRQVIPQPGVTNIDNMDYIFVMSGMTKQQVKRKFGVDVFRESEEYPEARSNAGEAEKTIADEMVTLITAYYRNKDGGIGVYRWVGNTEVQDLEDYYARRLRHCKKCGCVVSDNETVCSECGSKKFEYKNEDTTPLTRDVELNNGEVLNQMIDAEYQEDYMRDEEGNVLFDDYNNPMMQQIMTSPARPNEVPTYKIKQYPIVCRKNISRNNSILGISDVDTLRDTQELIKKLGSKVLEKLLKGGSYITLPSGVNIRKDGGELNVIELDDLAKKSLIDVYNMQPDISNDVSYQETIYQTARQLIGITDSFQGRKDTTATSGTAKQFAAAQTAGRLESGRVMKQAAYQRLYELMFKFMLAFADEPRPTISRGSEGDTEYGIFDRYSFLERDDNGELYFNDDFLFAIDTTNNLAQNREAMWTMAKENWQAGAFGNPQDINAQVIYWSLLDKYHYPGAKDTLSVLTDRKQEQEIAQQQMVQMGGVTNAMPEMQDRNVSVQNQGQQISSGLPQSQMQQF